MSANASWLQTAGLVSACLSVMVLAVYVNNADVSELCRGQRHDDALVAVVTDPATYALLALSAAVLVAAA